MQIGLIGLEKKGSALALALKNKGYEVVAYDLGEQQSDSIRQPGIKTVASLKDLAESVESKRIIWLLLPAGELIDVMLDTLTPYLSVGDIVIDGGDSDYRDSIRRAKTLEAFQVNFLDCGLSGNISEGSDKVYAMVGGNRFAFNHCEALFHAIAVPGGSLYCGTSGSGHFVNTIYNSVEDNVLQAISEGLEALQKSGFNLHLEKIATVWNHSLQHGLMETVLRKNSGR